MDRKRFLLKIVRVFGSLLITLSIIIILFVIFWKIELCRYQPLSKEDFQTLFSDYSSIKKVKSKDALFLTIHGEEYELYIYKIENAALKKDIPLLQEWNGRQLSEDATITPWTKEIHKIDDYHPIADSKIKRDFLLYWDDPLVFRSFIISDHRTYWFAYCPEEERFLYLIYSL